MNMMKKNGGFTLVELIVVIAILAILAGVAVPAYSGYVTKAKEAAVLGTCDAVKTAVFASYAEEGLAMPDAIEIDDEGAVTVGGEALPTDVATNFAVYYTGTPDMDGYSAEWASGEWDLTAPNADDGE